MSRRFWTIVGLMILPLVLFVGAKSASDKRELRALEIAVRGGTNGTGKLPTATRSPLDIGIVPLKTTIQPQPGRKVNEPGGTLILPVEVRNRSKQTITVRLAHEWHGGMWPPTDLFAYLPGKGALTPVYLAGETGSAQPTILAPGATRRLDARMNWPGTGSMRAEPIMNADRDVVYSLRLGLFLDKTDYIVSEKMKVRIVAD